MKLVTAVIQPHKLDDVREALAEIGVKGMTIGGQIYAQFISVVFTLAYSGIISLILLKIIDAVIGLRVNQEEESSVFDISLHDEQGYTI
ncbi:MAG TPA: hypothetical protein DIU35_10195 [Candidatus Latescibacteria bacterium]|nr:hypothetical protein [Gemmatimonadota bacterium]HCR17842.1 hypothetical protein [Candidatus Latescibacterota bacterium]|tara:strand:- start:151 stop:417 length:267 start_codon:yes stop_codon:yes gene_type:complete